MGRALEVISVSDTDTTLGDLAATAGSSLTIKNSRGEAGVHIIDGWYTTDSGGEAQLRIRSPRMHDNVDGFRLFADPGQVTRFWPVGVKQPLTPQDTIAIEGNVTTSGRLTASLLVYYEDLPGGEARLVDWDTISRRVRNVLSLRIDLAGALTIGAWSGEQGIAADQNLLKANVDYAVLGVHAEVAVHAIGIRGPDTANIRVAAPYDPSLATESAQYFRWLSMMSGLPCIPVINAANRDGTLVDMLDNTASTPDAAIILAELAA